MKLQFVSYDNIDIIKSNLKSWVDNFKQDSSDWLQDELGNALFSDTKFAEIPDFSLDMSADKPFLTEAENVKRIYGNLRFLSDSQASDERLWAGLCLGPFWELCEIQMDINKKCTVGNCASSIFLWLWCQTFFNEKCFIQTVVDWSSYIRREAFRSLGTHKICL